MEREGDNDMKYGPDITDEICKHIAIGMTRTDACILSDISYETFTQWMKKPEFSEAIKKAESKFKLRNVALIQKAADRQWQASAWLLERKFQDEFAVKQKLEHSGGGPVGRFVLICPDAKDTKETKKK